jgi:eukaryotic-like serine/threonine-protein kinase
MLGDSVRRRQPHRRTASAQPTRRPRTWPRTLTLLAAALVVPFAVGYIVAVYVLFPPSQATGTGGTPVPDLIGRSIGEAHRDLVAAGLGDMPTTELPHPEVPAGRIIAQSPLPGQQVRAGSTVRIAVSSGPARVLVPDVLGFSADRAESLLRRNGFQVSRAVLESPAPAGRVIRTEPEPGTARTLPANVNLIVSSGPPAEPQPGAFPDTTGAASLR